MLNKILLTIIALPLMAQAQCKTENDTQIPAGSRVIRQGVNLQKVFQRVMRYDCAGNVISDQEERVSRMC